MKIGIFRVVPGNSKLGQQGYFKFNGQLERYVKFESKGLGFEGKGVKHKATTSNSCTLYILKNGVQLYKYHFRYAILAANGPRGARFFI